MIKPKTWLILGPLFIITGAALWGTETYFRINLAQVFDSEVLVFHEHLFCIAFTLPFIFTSRQSLNKIKTVPRSSWIYLLLSGVIGSAIGTTFFTMSLSSLNPSVANVLLNFQPIITIFFASLLLHENLGRKFFLWAALALLCGFTIASNGVDFHGFRLSVGLVYITLAAWAWGFSTVAGRGAMLHIPLSVATAGRFIIGALSLLVSLVIKGKFHSDTMLWSQLGHVFVIKNFLWLSIFSGVIPLYLYFKGLSKTSASVGGFCELTQTLSALILTWGILHNPLSMPQVVAGALLIACVFKINFNFARANEEPKSSGVKKPIV